MPNYKREFMFVAIIFFALLENAKALQCYVCQSSVAGQCSDPFETTTRTLESECPEITPYCVKYKFIESYPFYTEELRRGCGSEDFCYMDEATHSESCYVCRTNLCNAAFVHVPSFLTIVSFLLAIVHYNS